MTFSGPVPDPKTSVSAIAEDQNVSDDNRRHVTCSDRTGVLDTALAVLHGPERPRFQETDAQQGFGPIPNRNRIPVALDRTGPVSATAMRLAVAFPKRSLKTLA